MDLFSTRVRYALRMMLAVSRASLDNKPMGLPEVARQTGISQRYLEQLVRPLKAAKLLRSVKGKRGGYRLGKPAAETSVADVIRASIGPFGVTPCVTDPGSCERADICECRLLYQLLTLQMRATLRDVTLADLSDVRLLEGIRQEVFRLWDEDSEAENPEARPEADSA